MLAVLPVEPLPVRPKDCARQGLKVGAIEEVAYRMGYVDAAQIEHLTAQFRGNPYADYLLAMIKDGNYINQARNGV